MADDISYEIYWTKDPSDDENSSLVHVPGVNDVGNRRPSVKMRARKTKEVKAKVPSKSPLVIEDLSTSKRTPLKSSNRKMNEADNNMKIKKKPSLKDLRPEDKKRVANLIRELARIGEEKENALEQLNAERNEFENKMLSIQEQYDSILQEREDLQKQYLDCQRLLSSYQTQLADQQEKMSQTLSDIVTSPQKVGKQNGNIPAMASLHLAPADMKYSTPHHNERYTNPSTGRNYNTDPDYSARHADKDHGGYSQNGKSHHYPQDLKPKYSSTGTSHRERDFNFQPRPIEPRDLYSDGQTSEYSVSTDNYGGRFKELYAPIPSTRPNWREIESTPPSTFESRTAGGEFKPLSPDDLVSDPDSERNGESKKPLPSYTDHNYSRNGRYAEDYKTTKVSERSLPAYSSELHKSSIPTYTSKSTDFRATPVSTALPSTQGLTSPELRRQQLLVQREQLRLEQIKLKSQLKNQESQLQLKQQQLKEQQDIHEDRLRYFERHGHFPPYNSPYTPHTPTYKKKYSPKSTCDIDSESDLASTNYPPGDLDHSIVNTPLRRLDLDDEDLVNSINAYDSLYHKSGDDYGDRNYPADKIQYSPGRNGTAVDTTTSMANDLLASRSPIADRHKVDIGTSPYRSPGHLQNMSPRSPRNVLDTSPYRSSQQPDTSPLRSPRNLSNTSPLYTDRSVGTSPYRSPTNLPDTRYTTESMKNPLERYENTGSVLSSPKQQHNLPVEVNRQRTSPPRCSQVNGYASSLTDIVDSMERATVQDLDNQDTYRPYLAKTPDLFASSNGAANYSNHDDSHILEEVFFLK